MERGGRPPKKRDRHKGVCDKKHSEKKQVRAGALRGRTPPPSRGPEKEKKSTSPPRWEKENKNGKTQNTGERGKTNKVPPKTGIAPWGETTANKEG